MPIKDLVQDPVLRGVCAVFNAVFLGILTLVGVIYTSKNAGQQAEAITEAKRANNLEETSQLRAWCKDGKDDKELAATEEYQKKCPDSTARGPPPDGSESSENGARTHYSLDNALPLAGVVAAGVVASTQDFLEATAAAIAISFLCSVLVSGKKGLGLFSTSYQTVWSWPNIIIGASSGLLTAVVLKRGWSPAGSRHSYHGAAADTSELEGGHSPTVLVGQLHQLTKSHVAHINASKFRDRPIFYLIHDRRYFTRAYLLQRHLETTQHTKNELRQFYLTHSVEDIFTGPPEQLYEAVRVLRVRLAPARNFKESEVVAAQALRERGEEVGTPVLKRNKSGVQLSDWSQASGIYIQVPMRGGSIQEDC